MKDEEFGDPKDDDKEPAGRGGRQVAFHRQQGCWQARSWYVPRTPLSTSGAQKNSDKSTRTSKTSVGESRNAEDWDVFRDTRRE